MSGPMSSCTYCNEGVKLWDETIRHDGEVFCDEGCKCAFIVLKEYERIMRHKDEVDELRHLGMLRQETKYITVEWHNGTPAYVDPYKGIKSMWCGDDKIWQNPDYEEGGKYYEDDKK